MLTCLCLSAITSFTFITAATSSAAEIDLQTIEAIGRQRVRTGEVIDEETSESRSHVSRERIERSTGTLAEVLAQESAVQFRQSGGFGSFSSVSIRAASGAQTGVFLDGILLNSGGNALVDLSTLDMLTLDSIDIYKGSAPLQLGHGTLGGAVNLQSLRATNEPVTRARLGLGSLSQRSLTLSHQGHYDGWDLATVISGRHSDNDFVFDFDNGTPLNSDDDSRETRVNSQATRTAALLRLGHEQSPDSRTDLTLQLAARDLGVPQWRNREDNEASYETSGSRLQLSQLIENRGNWNSRHSLYWHEDSAHFEDILGQVNVGAQDIENDTRTLGAKTYWEYLAESATVGLSLELRQESLDSDDALDVRRSFDAERSSALGTLHYAWFNEDGRWSITPALRFQTSHNTVSETDDLQPSEDLARLGLQLGTSYRRDPHWSVTANAGNYFREPSFTELYGSFGLIGGNPELQAERGINADVGIHYRRGSSHVSATLFASERDELIVTTFNSRGVGRPDNVGAASIRGLELSAEWQMTQRLTLRSNLTLQSAKNRQEDLGFHDRDLPGEAGTALFARVQYAVQKANCWYELNITRDRYFDTANLLPADDSEEHAIGIDWQNGHWQSSIAIHNLSDRNNEDFNGFPKPGRTWSLFVSRTI